MKHQELIKNLSNQCVACGLCLPVCPTYQKTQSELDSPRGRIALMKGVSEQNIEINDKFEYHINRCLSCGACEAVCPSKVKYLELLDYTRENIPQSHFLLKHFNKINRLSRFLPLHSPLITPNTTYFQPRKQTVDLFLGCVARLFDFATLRSTAKLLSYLGYHVRIHSEQTCCGAVYQHAGHTDSAKNYQQINEKVFEKSDFVLFTSSGCGTSLKQYLGDKAMDILNFLIKYHIDDLKLLVDRAYEQSRLKQSEWKKIAVHQPCTHKNQLKTANDISTFMSIIPNIELIDLEEQKDYQCCGGAGIYFLTQFELSNQLLEDKKQRLELLKPDLLITTNIGCALQLKRLGNIRMMHPIKLFSFII